MNGRMDLDRELSRYLEQRSTSRAPDGLLDAALVEIESTRQRPGWLVPERWMVAGRTVWWAPAPRTRLVLAVTLLVALAVAALVSVGSRPRLPRPFGPATPGVIVTDLHQHIGIVEPDGLGLRMLTSGPAHDSSPTYSRDGTKIAYVSEGADYSTALVVMDADGQNPKTLAEGLRPPTGDELANTIGLSWSPDSRSIAFSAAIGKDVEARIYLVAPDRPGATELGGPHMYGLSPSWSPDGFMIAFKRSYPCCGSPPSSLWLMAADGTNPHQLSAGIVDRPAWSPDGTHVAFAANGNQGYRDVFIVGVDGLTERNLTKSPHDDELSPSWSPDGTRLAFARLGRPAAVGPGSDPLASPGSFVIDADGSDLVRIADASVGLTAVFWSPDGTKILGFDDGFAGTRSDNIFILDPTGRAAPTTIPVTDIRSVSWQRLAP